MIKLTLGVKYIYIQLPEQVTFILDKLKDAGFDGYAVGGCIRDILLGKSPNDWDICTDASPQQTMDILSKSFHVVPTGIKYGTVTVVIGREHFEVTTYRIDGTYSDSRRPDSVYYAKSIIEDLSRRDFTINAMAYNPYSGLVDPFGGKKDIENRCITCVGSADSRIREDYLRALRAVRFACQLNFHIKQDTINAIKNNKLLVKNISMERIRDELCKILVTDRVGYGIRLLKNLGLLNFIIPGIDWGKELPNNDENSPTDDFHRICSTLDNSPSNLIVRLSLLFNYVHAQCRNESLLKTLLKNLKLDNITINKVFTLIKEQKDSYDLPDKELKKLIVSIGIENIDNYLDFIDALHTNNDANHNKSDILINMRRRCHKILKERQPISIKDLHINGNDLLKLGFRRGKDMGIVLNKLLEIVLENPEMNENSTLMDIARQELNKTM